MGNSVSSLSKKILQHRGPKTQVHPDSYHVAFEEWESDGKQPVSVTTVILVGAECAFRCTMCDLWKHTLDSATPVGSLPKQFAHAIGDRKATDWIKLYNGSNFFDPRSVPREDYGKLIELCRPYQRVVVENHPRILPASISEFANGLAGGLEIAMGLETIHPASMAILNKQCTLDEFQRACEWLLQQEISIRCFVLLQPPNTRSEESVEWAVRSTEFALKHGARHVSVIPTRGGNGIMEQLQVQGRFRPPTAWQLEETMELILGLRSHQVTTVDLWDWERLQGHCQRCSGPRQERLHRMSLEQRVIPYPEWSCDCSKGKGAIDA